MRGGNDIAPHEGGMSDHLRQKIRRPTDAPGKLPVPAKGNRVYYDGDGGVPGFGVRVTANGHRSFVLTYWTKAGRQRRIAIGTFPNWTIGAARIKARELKRLIEAGGDPLGDIEAEREAPTVADLCDRFVEEHFPRLGTSSRISACIPRLPMCGLRTSMPAP